MDEAGRFFEALEFRHDWRKYRRLVLDLFEGRDRARRTFHVVAPPGVRQDARGGGARGEA
jgi:hypothetical protein